MLKIWIYVNTCFYKYLIYCIIASFGDATAVAYGGYGRFYGDIWQLHLRLAVIELPDVAI